MGPRGARPTRGVGEASGGDTCCSFRRGRTSIPGTISQAAARGKTTCRLSLTVCAVCRICSARPLVPTDAHRDRRLVCPPGRVRVRAGASVTQPETFVEGRREILRQASVALGGRPVTVWEVSARAELEPQASSETAPTHHATKPDGEAHLRRGNITIVQGSRWGGGRGAGGGDWVGAPGRARPPPPPPAGPGR